MQSILVANRGEIAARLMQTMQRMGFRALAVYSDADAGAVHVRMADGACRIGPPPVRESYLHAEAILVAALALQADAVHPGYGFLAEDADFAQAVLDRGLTWIGPPPAAMRAMGNKAAAKRLLANREVPLLPGYQGLAQDDAALRAEAARIGLPLMIKAAAGGGGRGMRLVLEEHELESALERARSEALHAFASSELILERALFGARHVEVQVFADAHGNVVHLGERDCSVQRRHQKLIEETPSPAVDPALRARLGAAAVSAARACGYVGAGTVEFLLDADGAFWFMEMNTRLQVEHPVTEAVTGIDLVEWQLRVAAGERLPMTQPQIDARLAQGGHAIEVRLCAEDPAQDFLPQAGKIALWRPPAQIRVDHALEDGQLLPPFYDSMVAKLIAHADTREQARRMLARQLGECLLLGVPTNQDFLVGVLNHPEFAAGQANTGFIDAFCKGSQEGVPNWPATVVAGALLLALRTQKHARYPAELQGWTSSGALEHELELELDGAPCRLAARPEGAGKWQLAQDGNAARIDIAACGDSELRLQLDGAPYTVTYAAEGERIHFRHAGRNHVLRDLAFLPVRPHTAGAADGIIRAPMNARVALLHAALGENVDAGQPLIVLEAMKMEHALAAPCAGILRALHVKVGEQVAPGGILAEVAAAPDA